MITTGAQERNHYFNLDLIQVKIELNNIHFR